MKIWVTRQSAGSIYAGGLERLTVHFIKPVWMEIEYPAEARDLPFGHYGEDHGFYKHYGWVEIDQKYGIRNLSVGSWLGYSDEDNPDREAALFIWNRLCEHFNNANFRDWEKLENAGVVRRKDFLLEIDLKLTIDNTNENKQTQP